MSYTQVLEDINNLPHFREFTCKNCGHKQSVFVLTIQSNCEKCGTRSKLRGYASIGTEIEDVIDAVLQWVGTGVELDEVIRRIESIREHR